MNSHLNRRTGEPTPVYSLRAQRVRPRRLVDVLKVRWQIFGFQKPKSSAEVFIQLATLNAQQIIASINTCHHPQKCQSPYQNQYPPPPTPAPNAPLNAAPSPQSHNKLHNSTHFLPNPTVTFLFPPAQPSQRSPTSPPLRKLSPTSKDPALEQAAESSMCIKRVGGGSMRG